MEHSLNLFKKVDLFNLFGKIEQLLQIYKKKEKHGILTISPFVLFNFFLFFFAFSHNFFTGFIFNIFHNTIHINIVLHCRKTCHNFGIFTINKQTDFSLSFSCFTHPVNNLLSLHNMSKQYRKRQIIVQHASKKNIHTGTGIYQNRSSVNSKLTVIFFPIAKLERNLRYSVQNRRYYSRADRDFFEVGELRSLKFKDLQKCEPEESLVDHMNHSTTTLWYRPTNNMKSVTNSTGNSTVKWFTNKSVG